MSTETASAVREFAAAKINLTLHVTGRRQDGYHLLDSLVAFADVGDELELLPAEEFSLDMSGPFGNAICADSENLVLRAARKLASQRPGEVTAAQIKLAKNLPVASGMGGGSADAAATLRGLNRMWGRDRICEGDASIALAIGADVPVCLNGENCRMTGIGEGIATISNMPTFFAVLVNPMRRVETAQIFKQLALEPGENGFAVMDELPGPTNPEGWISWLKNHRNDLEQPAIREVPQIGDVLSEIRASNGCALARMSGSGATCFGLYSDKYQRDAATARIASQNRQWWVTATRLG